MFVNYHLKGGKPLNGVEGLPLPLQWGEYLERFVVKEQEGLWGVYDLLFEEFVATFQPTTCVLEAERYANRKNSLIMK